MNQPSLHISTISSALVGTATTGVFLPSTSEKTTYCCHDLFRTRFHDFLIWQKEIKKIQENASKSMKQWKYRPFGYSSWEFPDQSEGLVRWENHWTILDYCWWIIQQAVEVITVRYIMVYPITIPLPSGKLTWTPEQSPNLWWKRIFQALFFCRVDVNWLDAIS